jgi:hypothetical protein
MLAVWLFLSPSSGNKIELIDAFCCKTTQFTFPGFWYSITMGFPPKSDQWPSFLETGICVHRILLDLISSSYSLE